MESTDSVLSPFYRPRVLFALTMQILISLVAGLLLDGGQTARAVGVALLGFWIGTALLIARRPTSPTAVDLLWVQWGFLPVVIALACLRG